MVAGSWEVLEELTPFLTGTTLLAWGFATWWIPLLLAIGIWRHGVQHVPIRYDPQYWSLVFPLGMFAASTFRMGAAIDVGLPAAVAAVAFWIAFFGLARHSDRDDRGLRRAMGSGSVSRQSRATAGVG